MHRHTEVLQCKEKTYILHNYHEKWVRNKAILNVTLRSFK